MKIWNWVLANLSDIKDLFWIVFTLVTTVVAVLTYRRAKMTLLQPLRSEVIKRQTDNLVCLLDYLDPKNVRLFTEQGIYMLMTVLKGDLAVTQSKMLIRTFKEMKHFIQNNSHIFAELDNIKNHLLESD